ncbi:MAG: hypothetical protein Q7S07_04450 [Candidatus Omnitrophota bacterium]|nr:hypothetical protein [Candidatus Omnitrophota bacterium]
MDENIAKPQFKRKQLIVARKFQLKYAGIILLMMFITAGFCSYAIYYSTMILFGEKLANVYPQGQLVSVINAVNFRILVSALVASPLIGFLGIYLSHKIAGPIFRIEKVLGNMAKGDLSSRIMLRQGDEMVSLADSVNNLTDSFSLTIKTEKSRIENIKKEFDALRKQAPPSSAIEKMENEINLISKELDRYKV